MFSECLNLQSVFMLTSGLLCLFLFCSNPVAFPQLVAACRCPDPVPALAAGWLLLAVCRRGCSLGSTFRRVHGLSCQCCPSGTTCHHVHHGPQGHCVDSHSKLFPDCLYAKLQVFRARSVNFALSHLSDCSWK